VVVFAVDASFGKATGEGVLGSMCDMFEGNSMIGEEEPGDTWSMRPSVDFVSGSSSGVQDSSTGPVGEKYRMRRGRNGELRRPGWNWGF
jgi:hypothetical protein